MEIRETHMFERIEVCISLVNTQIRLGVGRLVSLTKDERKKDATVVIFLYTVMIMGVALIGFVIVLSLLGVDPTEFRDQNLHIRIAFIAVLVMFIMFYQTRKIVSQTEDPKYSGIE